MASIRKRGASQWEARVRKRGWPFTCKTFATKYDATKWARGIESEMDRGIFVSRVEAESTTLSEALERYIEEHAPKLSDSMREEDRARAIQRRPLASRFMATIKAKDIAAFIKVRQDEGVGPNTIRLDLVLLSKFFEIAATDWGMESLANPVKRANKPKLPAGRSRRLEDDEEERLLPVCDPRFALVVRFALETAMSSEEIATMDWTQVDLKNRSVLLPRTKNGEARTVPLSPAALGILKSFPRVLAGPVFRMNKDQITRHMVNATKKAEIEDFTFHDLRHEAVSRLFENTDLDVIEILASSGHKSMQMLARYSHLRTRRLSDRLAGKGR